MHPLTTDFSAYTHEELLRMLYAGDPGTVRAAADRWRDTARAVQERGDDVRAQLAKFSPYWQGGAADQYKTMMTELVDGVGQVGERLATTRDLVYSAAEALTRAQAEAPATVPVPVLGPAAGALATWPSPAATAAWDTMTEDHQLQVADELRTHQSASTAAEAAHGDAAAVMTELAMHYLPIEDAIPHLPDPASTPQVPDDVASANLVAGQPWVDGLDADDSGSGSSATGSADRPLFADMYRSGSLAASSAVLGRFSLGARWLARLRAEKLAGGGSGAGGSGASGGSGGGGSAGGSGTGDGAAAGGSDGGAPRSGAGTNPGKALGGAGVGGLGGGGLGGGGLGGGGSGGGGFGGVAEPATANPALAGSTASSGGSAGGSGGGSSALSSLSSGGAGAASGGRAGGMGGSMMPFMPMGGMGDGGGMNRRIPPWLVETESVFGGESVPVTPPVIGEIPDEPAGGSGWRPIG